MAIELLPAGLIVSTTDTHLPRRIGESLKRAYHGERSGMTTKMNDSRGSHRPTAPWSHRPLRRYV